MKKTRLKMSSMTQCRQWRHPNDDANGSEETIETTKLQMAKQE